jgi:hypothetical protein
MRAKFALPRQPTLNNVQNIEMIPMLQPDILTNISNIISCINQLHLTP